MTENEKRLSAEERKQKIRERYKGVDKDELEVIPAGSWWESMQTRAFQGHLWHTVRSSTGCWMTVMQVRLT